MKIKKIILTATFVLTLSVCSLQSTITAYASNQGFSTEQYGNSVTPKSDYIEWIYKVENGKLYKRLYNASTATWLGDWIYVCEYPG
jgi:hypothetical protein